MNSKKTLTYQKLQRDFSGYRAFMYSKKDSPSVFNGLNWSTVYHIVNSKDFKSYEQSNLLRRKRWFIRQSKINRRVVESVVFLFQELRNIYYRKNKNNMAGLDQFYTHPQVALQCFQKLKHIVDDTTSYKFIEPSAGDGAFFKLMPVNSIGIDLEPKYDGIIESDFLKFKYVSDINAIVLGNPPFGKNSSLAVKFFNHAASFSNVEYIAFIVPKTFRKVSLKNKLSMEFHLIFDMDLPDDSFLKDGEPYKVPTCFQVWKRMNTQRNKVIIPLDNKWFTFVKKTESPDLAIRRVGGKTGVCLDDVTPCKTHSFYFLKLKSGIDKGAFQSYINSLRGKNIFSELSKNTAGVKSMSMGEFIDVLKKYPF